MSLAARIPIATGATPTAIIGKYSGAAFAVQNVGTVDVLVGGSDVTTATGWPLLAGPDGAGAVIVVDVGELAEFYGVVDGATPGELARLRVK